MVGEKEDQRRVGMGVEVVGRSPSEKNSKKKKRMRLRRDSYGDRMGRMKNEEGEIEQGLLWYRAIEEQLTKF